MGKKLLLLLVCLLSFGGCDGADSDGEATDESIVEARFDESDPLAFAPDGNRGGVQLDCTPNCEGTECGPDGCGGSCGGCPSQTICGNEGVCVAMSYEDGTCHAMAPCVLGCQADPLCYEDCADGASNDVLAEMELVLNCNMNDCGHCENKGEMSWACMVDCMLEACPAEYETCFTGDMGCWNVAQCIKGCNEDDEECAPSCFGLATLASQQVWVDIFFCVYEVCGQAPTDACKAEAMQGDCHDFVVECLVL